MSSRLIRTIIQGQTVATAPPLTTVEKAAIIMRAVRVGALAVLENDKLVGIFTERDALFRVIAAGRDPALTIIGDVMTANPRTITPNSPLSHALHLMHQGGYRHVPVVEHGYLVGMVSVRDAMGADFQELHEVLDGYAHLSETLN